MSCSYLHRVWDLDHSHHDARDLHHDHHHIAWDLDHPPILMIMITAITCNSWLNCLIWVAVSGLISSGGWNTKKKPLLKVTIWTQCGIIVHGEFSTQTVQSENLLKVESLNVVQNNSAVVSVLLRLKMWGFVESLNALLDRSGAWTVHWDSRHYNIYFSAGVQSCTLLSKHIQ